MLKERPLKLVLYISLFLAIFVGLIMLVLIIFNFAFLIGWLVGCIASITGYLLNAFTIRWLFLKRRSKKNGFMIGMFRLWIQLIYYGIWIFIVILIDALVHHEFLFSTSVYSMLYPIHIITFIAGISVVTFSVFLAHLPIFKERENGQIKSEYK